MEQNRKYTQELTQEIDYGQKKVPMDYSVDIRKYKRRSQGINHMKRDKLFG